MMFEHYHVLQTYDLLKKIDNIVMSSHIIPYTRNVTEQTAPQNTSSWPKRICSFMVFSNINICIWAYQKSSSGKLLKLEKQFCPFRLLVPRFPHCAVKCLWMRFDQLVMKTFKESEGFLVIQSVSFLGWLSDPFRKVVGDLQRSGIKRSRLESPG